MKKFSGPAFWPITIALVISKIKKFKGIIINRALRSYTMIRKTFLLNKRMDRVDILWVAIYRIDRATAQVLPGTGVPQLQIAHYGVRLISSGRLCPSRHTITRGGGTSCLTIPPIIYRCLPVWELRSRFLYRPLCPSTGTSLPLPRSHSTMP